MKSRLKIIDYLSHGGNQYEFSKLNHDFFITGLDSKVPDWTVTHRPLNKNVTLISEREALSQKFDIVIIRSVLNPKRYEPYIKRGAIPVAAIQTTSTFPMSPKVKHIVWNCSDTMAKYAQNHYPKKSHYHIVHGFDPDEFKQLEIDKIERVLSVVNVFKKRAKLTGYQLWDDVNNQLGLCDLVGHGNTDINLNIKEADTFEELIRIYNSYAVFLNTTLESAMPRSRGEAAMCGNAIISTNNYSIGRYFKHKKNILFANSASEMCENIKYLLDNKSFREDLGNNAREVAIKHFNVKDYVDHWNHVFGRL